MSAQWRLILWGVIGLGLLLLALAVRQIRLNPPLLPTPKPTATATREPIIPTPTPGQTLAPSPLAPTPLLLTATPAATPATPMSSPVPSATASATSTPTQPTATAAPPTVAPGVISYHQRFGAAGSTQVIMPALAAGLPLGAYLDWHINSAPPQPNGVAYWQMVRLTSAGPVESWDALAAVISARPGSVWIVGNEPDVVWQDNLTAPRYAELYHDVYTFIKERDAGAQIAVGGVSQSTPLRRAYLDLALDTYQARYGSPMPVDIWTVHAFTLREEANSWGVGIPPGLDVVQGRLYEIADHNNLDYFRQNLIDFRAWMAGRGYGDRPLAVTEFGILLPNDYGFPPASVAAFLVGTFDFLLTAANPTGYPPDNNRLVQWWFWYSIEDLPSYYPTGDLYSSARAGLTNVGQAYADFFRLRQP